MPRPPLDNPHIPEQALKGLSRAAELAPQALALENRNKILRRDMSPRTGGAWEMPASTGVAAGTRRRRVKVPWRPAP